MRSTKRFLAASLVAGVALLGAACESDGGTTTEDTGQVGETGDTGDTGDMGTGDATGGTETETP